MGDVSIRPYAAGDDDDLYEVCLRTGANGDDASSRYTDPRLLGEVYVGPYLLLARDFAFVAADDDGIVGYVLGAADSVAFEAECEQRWWSPLRRRYPSSAFPDGSADAAIVRLIHSPPRTAKRITTTYPAHLHIDLLPRAQGRGLGRRMLETLFAALAAAGAGGVHLGVGAGNTRAIGFYRRLGFSELERSADAIVMGRLLTPRPVGGEGGI